MKGKHYQQKGGNKQGAARLQWLARDMVLKIDKLKMLNIN